VADSILLLTRVNVKSSYGDDRVSSYLLWASAMFLPLVVFGSAYFRNGSSGNSPTTETHENPYPPKGLSIGTTAPIFTSSGLDDNILALRTLIEQRQAFLLIFVSPNCEDCQALVPSIHAWREKYGLTLVLVSIGNLSETESKLAGFRDSPFCFCQGGRMAEAFGASVFPSAVLIDRNAKIASELQWGADKIVELLSTLEH